MLLLLFLPPTKVNTSISLICLLLYSSLLKLLAVWPDGFFLLFILEKSVSQLVLFPFFQGSILLFSGWKLKRMKETHWLRSNSVRFTWTTGIVLLFFLSGCVHTLVCCFPVKYLPVYFNCLFWFSCFKVNCWHLWTSLQCVARLWPFLIQRNVCKRCKNSPAASCCPVAMVTGHTTTILWPGVWRPVWISVSLCVCAVCPGLPLMKRAAVDRVMWKRRLPGERSGSLNSFQQFFLVRISQLKRVFE